MKEYVAKSGDCISSIAEREGFFWESVWAANSELKAKRKNPNVLAAGDVVVIPDKTPKLLDLATEKRHKFLKKGVPATFRLVVQIDGQPIANERYVLVVDGLSLEGDTDDQGFLEVAIPPDATSAELRIRDLVYQLQLGGLDPIDELTGVQDRLQNLGFYTGPIDGAESKDLTHAIEEFQAAAGLTVNGKLDQQTRDALVDAQDAKHAADAPAEAHAEAEEPAAAPADHAVAHEHIDDATLPSEPAEAEFPSEHEA
jgi:hypothetical protein